MKVHKWKNVRNARLAPAAQTRVDAWVGDEIVRLNLRTLRETIGKTQAQVAAAAKMTQGELSRAERRDDHRVSHLRRIVKAMGGDVEIRAVFGKKSVRLDGV